MASGCRHCSRHGDVSPLVLVVDPNSGVGEALALAVALKTRAHVERVAGGVEAVTIVARRSVDLVIAAAHLPDVSLGVLMYLLRRLQPDLPIAILGETPHPMEMGRQRADGHFSKPFELKPFLGWVGDRLSQAPVA